MTPRVPADLSQLSHEQKDALIGALLAEIEAQKAANAALSARLAELEAKLKQPPKTPDNSSTPPSRGQKRNQPAKAKREGQRVAAWGAQAAAASWRLSRISSSPPSRRTAAIAGRRCERTIMFCTDVTISSTCRRCARWSRGWNATPGAAQAVAA
jgi:Family of unknown function (DUF6444)